MRSFFEIRRKRDIVVLVVVATLFCVVVSALASMPAIAKVAPEDRALHWMIALGTPLVCCSVCCTAMAALIYRITLMRDELARLAVTDVLTGVGNRRGFFEKARALLGGGAARGYGAFVIDLDFFKEINDTHGHDAGDQVLAAVGGALSRQFGEPDVVGRTGGEEFAVLARWDEAFPPRMIAEAIRTAISDLRIGAAVQTLRVTASIGYTQVCSVADLEAALTRADGALYRAKERGRNRVEAALAA